MSIERNLRLALHQLVEAIEYTPMGVRGIKAMANARKALEAAQQPATAIACGIPGMTKTTCPYCEQGFAFEHEQPATTEPVVSRNPFASRCYTMSESHLSGHRLIVGFEKLGDAQDAHEWVTRQGRGDFTHPAPSVPAPTEPVDHVGDRADMMASKPAEPVGVNQLRKELSDANDFIQSLADLCVKYETLLGYRKTKAPEGASELAEARGESNVNTELDLAMPDSICDHVFVLDPKSSIRICNKCGTVECKKHTHPAPSVPADVVRDAERYRWLAGYCLSTSEHWGGRWSIIIDGPAPKTHDSEDDLDAAIDAAMLAAK